MVEQETNQEYIDRKVDQAIEYIQDAKRAKAILNPSFVDGIESNGMATISITIKIKEVVLHKWRTEQEKGV